MPCKNSSKLTLTAILCWHCLLLSSSAIFAEGLKSQKIAFGASQEAQVVFFNKISRLSRDFPTETERFKVYTPKVLEIYPSSNPAEEPDMALISGGNDQGFKIGDILSVERDQRSSDELRTTSVGEIKVVKVQERNSIAAIVSNQNLLAQKIIYKHAKPMAGDSLVKIIPQTIATQIITPIIELGYHKVFIDPLSNPHSFEISSDGKKQIIEAMSEFSDFPLAQIVIEAYTDDEGASEANQVESQQRAAIVRLFAINELGLDPSRIAALGFGETNQLDQNYAPDYRAKNRRIVIKAIPSQGKGE